MTDGDFNTPYKDGVIAGDAGVGSGSLENHINANATNGSSTSQAQQLCAAIKSKGIVIYTVGFDVVAGSEAATLLSGCALSSDKAFLAGSGAELLAAFRAVGQDIGSLRISK